MGLIIRNFLGYEFKKLNETECSIPFNEYNTTKDARQACIDDKQCEGIQYDDCNNETKIVLCMKDGALIASSGIKSCVYMKFPIGRTNIL